MFWENRKKTGCDKKGNFKPDGEYAIDKAKRINETVADAVAAGKTREQIDKIVLQNRKSKHFITQTNNRED